MKYEQTESVATDYRAYCNFYRLFFFNRIDILQGTDKSNCPALSMWTNWCIRPIGLLLRVQAVQLTLFIQYVDVDCCA